MSRIWENIDKKYTQEDIVIHLFCRHKQRLAKIDRRLSISHSTKVQDTQYIYSVQECLNSLNLHIKIIRISGLWFICNIRLHSLNTHDHSYSFNNPKKLQATLKVIKFARDWLITDVMGSHCGFWLAELESNWLLIGWIRIKLAFDWLIKAMMDWPTLQGLKKRKSLQSCYDYDQSAISVNKQQINHVNVISSHRHLLQLRGH